VLAVPGAQGTEGGTAQAQRLVEQRVEHRAEVSGVGVDDAQYLGGRGLLFERLLRLGNQPRVFHRDNRLRGEVFQ